MIEDCNVDNQHSVMERSTYVNSSSDSSSDSDESLQFDLNEDLNIDGGDFIDLNKDPAAECSSSHLNKDPGECSFPRDVGELNNECEHLHNSGLGRSVGAAAALPHPEVGMEFSSWDDMNNYYRTYGEQEGFGVVCIGGRKNDVFNKGAYSTYVWKCECYGTTTYKKCRQLHGVLLLYPLETLDHFGYYQSTIDWTFQQRVYVNDTLWSGAKAGGPIFELFGREVVDNGDPGVYDLLNECANEFKAMLVHIQIYSFLAINVEPNSFNLRMACDQIVRWGDYDIQGFSLALETVMFKKHCFNSVLLEVESPYEPYSDYTIARAWQRCNELIFPVGCANQTMFPPQPFLQTQFDESCRRRFGIASRPQTPISFYGGRDIIESIKGFGGNIIFSNGLRDPFSSGGILKDLSKTILSVTTTQGSYALDMGFEKVTYPKWLRRQRAAERKIFRRWINQYNHRNQGSNLKHSLILYGLQGLVVLYMSKLI